MSEMKLSEAIRLGAMNTEQARCAMRDPQGRTCAMGSALDAAGLLDLVTGDLIYNETITLHPKVRERFPILAEDAPLTLRDGTSTTQPLYCAIAYLNDTMNWTREQIADWVETIERRAEADQARTETETPTTSVSLVAQKA